MPRPSRLFAPDPADIAQRAELRRKTEAFARETARRRRAAAGAKHLAAVLADDVPKKYKEVRRALGQAGWRVVRRSGSHEVWARPDTARRIVVAGKDSDTVPPGTLASIRRASGLEDLR